MRKLWYLPLEPYQERYTLQLQTWNETRFKRRGINFESILGSKIDESDNIKVGQVLDAHGRCYWATTQIAELIKRMSFGEVTGEDIIFSEDLFHPGFVSLPYILEQLPKENRPKIFTRNLAQSIDPDDFVFPWREWMRPFEQIVDRTATGILMANHEMGWHMRVGMLNKSPLYVTGLPFDSEEVLSRIGGKNNLKPLKERTNRVSFCSRWDKEKQPWFYMDLIEEFHKWANNSGNMDLIPEFCILTGSKKLKSTNQEYIDRAYNMRGEGKLKIYEGLNKNEYYSLLSDSRVHFTCNLQEWVGNTLNEASTFGVLPLHGAYRAFPETLFNEARHLYVPWSIEDAMTKLIHLLENPVDTKNICQRRVEEADKCIDRTIDIFQGNTVVDGIDYQYYDR